MTSARISRCVPVNAQQWQIRLARPGLKDRWLPGDTVIGAIRLDLMACLNVPQAALGELEASTHPGQENTRARCEFLAA
jgi:hypothetical protein